MEQIVDGVSTIQDLSYNPPMKIPVPYAIEYRQATLQQGWNACHIAIIPYCIACKKPLTWHRYPEGEVIFHCETCGREWIMGEGWEKKKDE